MELRKRFREHIWLAHLSQPLGIPLHKYRGELGLSKDEISLFGKDKDTGKTFNLIIRRDKVKGVFLGWDEALRRWRDTKALIRPLRVTFEDAGGSRTLYIYAKRQEAAVYGKENKQILELIS